MKTSNKLSTVRTTRHIGVRLTIGKVKIEEKNNALEWHAFDWGKNSTPPPIKTCPKFCYLLRAAINLIQITITVTIVLNKPTLTSNLFDSSAKTNDSGLGWLEQGMVVGTDPKRWR